jgi:diguanylate cyclase (GGDEF)-like protein
MMTPVALYSVLSTAAAVVLALVVVYQRRAAAALKKLACTESVTGLANRREFEEVLRAEISRTSRTGRPFVVMLVDVDRLKSINDRYGHRAGDRAILRVANTLRHTCRVTDTAARIGGDEFAVILPETSIPMAMLFLNRIRALLASHRRSGAVTVSAGIARFPHDGATVEGVLEAADRALYAEKWRRPRSATPSSIPRLVPGSQRQTA